MDFSQIKFDCVFYKGDIPCTPNKLRGKICSDCDEYSRIVKRILIIKLGAIGDVIRTTPLVSKYKSIYPQCQISWITHSPEILTSKLIDKTYTFNFESVYKLKSINFDIAVNLDKDTEACLLLSQVNAKEKHGFFWNDGHIDVTNRASENKLLMGLFDSLSKENKMSYLQEIFAMCELEFKNEPYLLEADQKYTEKWNLLKRDAGVKKIIGLNTGCGKRWPTRMWPKEYWLQLMNSLKAGGFYPVLLGGPDENDDNIFYAESTGTYYPGTFTLREFISIIANCDLIVSAVSLSMHIAIALGKPLVLFNNIFNKHEFELYGKGKIIEPVSGCDCYYGSVCKRERYCMYDISPDCVLDTIVKVVE
jgi:heptosyltransferase-2